MSYGPPLYSPLYSSALQGAAPVYGAGLALPNLGNGRAPAMGTPFAPSLPAGLDAASLATMLAGHNSPVAPLPLSGAAPPKLASGSAHAAAPQPVTPLIAGPNGGIGTAPVDPNAPNVSNANNLLTDYSTLAQQTPGYNDAPPELQDAIQRAYGVLGDAQKRQMQAGQRLDQQLTQHADIPTYKAPPPEQYTTAQRNGILGALLAGLFIHNAAPAVAGGVHQYMQSRDAAQAALEKQAQQSYADQVEKAKLFEEEANRRLSVLSASSNNAASAVNSAQANVDRLEANMVTARKQNAEMILGINRIATQRAGLAEHIRLDYVKDATRRDALQEQYAKEILQTTTNLTEAGIRANTAVQVGTMRAQAQAALQRVRDQEQELLQNQKLLAARASQARSFNERRAILNDQAKVQVALANVRNDGKTISAAQAAITQAIARSSAILAGQNGTTPAAIQSANAILDGAIQSPLVQRMVAGNSDIVNPVDVAQQVQAAGQQPSATTPAPTTINVTTQAAAPAPQPPATNVHVDVSGVGGNSAPANPTLSAAAAEYAAAQAALATNDPEKIRAAFNIPATVPSAQVGVQARRMTLQLAQKVLSLTSGGAQPNIPELGSLPVPRDFDTKATAAPSSTNKKGGSIAQVTTFLHSHGYAANFDQEVRKVASVAKLRGISLNEFVDRQMRGLQSDRSLPPLPPRLQPMMRAYFATLYNTAR